MRFSIAATLRPRALFAPCACLLVAALASNKLHAQATTATILGTVTDTSGAAVADAAVQIKNVATGITQNVATDTGGRYRVPDLGLGDYDVQASKAGFQTVVRKGITLAVGSESVVDFSLPVGQTQQTVLVEGQASQVETTSAAVGNVVESVQVRDLPLNGRSYTQLLALAPGVQTAAQATQDPGSAFYGRGAQYSVAGSRLYGQSFLLDDTDVADFFGHGVGSAATGDALGVEAIAEFQALTATYGAQFGGNGAVLNAVSKSGTNGLHGSAYEFFRNNVLDARDYFDLPRQPDGDRNPPFRRNQFGGSLGGPIKKDKAFFFVNYEGLRQLKVADTPAFVPDANARNGFLPCAQAPSYPCVGGLANVGFASPALRDVLSLFPATSLTTPTGVADIDSAGNQIANENYLLVRFDYAFSAEDSLFFRYVLDRAQFQLPSTPVLYTEQDLSRSHIATLEERHVSANLVNLARISFVRPAEYGNYLNPVATAPDGTHPLQYYPGLGIEDGGVTIAGLSNGFYSIGPSGILPTAVVPNRFTEADDVYWTRGAHNFKFGIAFERFQQNDTSGFGGPGAYSFTGLLQFMQGTPSLYLGNLPGQFNDARYFREFWITPYFQDDWKVTPKLTLNLGLRYAWGANPSEATNNLYQLINPPYATVPSGASVFPSAPSFVHVPNVWQNNPNTKNFDPRIGLAYDLFGDHKTSIRAGFGMFHELIKATIYQAAYVLNPPYTTIAAPYIPSPAPGVPPICVPAFGPVTPGGSGASNLNCPQEISNTQGYDYATNATPYMMQYNFSIQREIGMGNVITLGYVGSEGRHLWYTSELNPPLPNTPTPGVPPGAPCGLLACAIGSFIATNPRVNPTAGYLDYYQPVGTSNYNSLQASFNHRFSHNLQTQLSYTFSKSLDEASNSIGLEAGLGQADTSSNPYSRNYDYGPSTFSRKNNFTASAVYDLPFQANHVLGGWELSTVLTAVSGFPFSPAVGFDNEGLGAPTTTGAERPNIAPNCTYSSAVIGNPSEWYNPACFVLPQVGTPGDIGRTSLIGPGLFDIDFALMKNTRIKERMNTQFRAEFFNILNHPNFGIPNTSTFVSGGAISQTAGVITTTTTYQRQIQFGLKIIF
jgi:hypothetical protein